MEWVKFIAELFIQLGNSYVQLIGHIAWPVAIVVILLIFRKPIETKIRDILKIGIGKALIECATPEMKEKLVNKVKFTKVTKTQYTWENYLDAMEQWALWIIWYAREAASSLVLGDKSLTKIKRVQLAIGQFNMVVKKIEEQNPDSVALKYLNKLKDELDTFLSTFNLINPESKNSSV